MSVHTAVCVTVPVRPCHLWSDGARVIDRADGGGPRSVARLGEGGRLLEVLERRAEERLVLLLDDRRRGGRGRGRVGRRLAADL